MVAGEGVRWWLIHLQVLEENYKAGRLRSIGVSNYTVEHLNQLLDSCTITPHVVQVNLNPDSTPTPDTPGGGAPAVPAEGAGRPVPGEEHSCPGETHGLILSPQAYSSLGQERASPLLSCPLVAGVASLLGKSPAQILLRLFHFTAPPHHCGAANFTFLLFFFIL